MLLTTSKCVIEAAPTAGADRIRAQIFCSLAIYILLWYVIFDPFNKDAPMSARRTHIWALAHLPLHISLLLVLEGIIGVILVRRVRQPREAP